MQKFIKIREYTSLTWTSFLHSWLLCAQIRIVVVVRLTKGKKKRNEKKICLFVLQIENVAAELIIAKWAPATARHWHKLHHSIIEIVHRCFSIYEMIFLWPAVHIPDDTLELYASDSDVK